MGDESRWNDQNGPDWGDRYRRDDRQGRERYGREAAYDDREECRYGAGDFEGAHYDRYDDRRTTRGAWPTYDPGRRSPDYRDRSGEEHGWERIATEQGYGRSGDRAVHRETARDFAGWDAPFGGRPVERGDERQGERERTRGEGRSFIDRTLDRTREELASLFGAGRRDDDGRDDEAYRAARREGDYRGRGPRGYRRSDERIREDVNERLTEDSWLDASSIEVTVYGGEVTLDGVVRTRADKRRAEDLVERVLGVGHVQNNLRADSDRGSGRDHPDMPPLI